MSKRWILLVVFCLLLLAIPKGYQWYQETPKEEVEQILFVSTFFLVYLIIPIGIAVYLLLPNTIRRLRARGRRKEPWESEMKGDE